MPTYEYQCQRCAHNFEAFQPITQEPLKVCPQCQGRLKRLISAGAGIIFKGSGFYATDYRSKEYKERQQREGKGKAGGCPNSSNETCKKCPVNE